MVKPFKNLLLWNLKADDIQTWYAALRTQVLPNLFKQIWSCMLLDRKKVKTMFFSETIVVHDIKADAVN